MRARDHLDAARREIEAAIGAALNHALELAAHRLRSEMAHLDEDPAMRARMPLADAIDDGAADDVARGALGLLVITEHEALAARIGEIAAGAAQPLLQHRAGHAGILASEKPCRVELHHLHVA